MKDIQNKINLKRTIGVFGLACTVVNITIGTGIFVLPALVAEHLGAAAILCFFVCGLLIFLIGLCFAEVGSKVTGSGGTYSYIEKAFGPLSGFLANNIFWFSCVLSDAAVANGLSRTLSYFFPTLDAGFFRPLFFLLLFGGLAFINVRGTKKGLRFIIITTLAKLIPLLVIILFGISAISPGNLEWQASFSVADIGTTSLILFFAFCGIEAAVSSSGEIKNPSRVIPLGILSGLGIILLLYVSIQMVTQGMLGPELLSYKESPLSEVAKRLFGYTGIILITTAIAISMLGSLSGSILSVPRVLFAGARNNIFPSYLGRVHPKYFTPHVSIMVYAGIGYMLAVFGTLKQLVILSSATTLLIYLGVVLAVIRLRYNKTPYSEKPFIIPGGLFIPILTTAFIVWILSNLTKEEIVGICIAIIVLSILYWTLKRFKKGFDSKTDVVSDDWNDVELQPVAIQQDRR